MAFLISKSSSLARFQAHPQPNKIENPIVPPRRQFHIELGAREKALLEEDPALKKFKSYKRSVKRVKRFGDVGSIIIIAACSYEIYVKTMMKKAAVEEAKAKESSS